MDQRVLGKYHLLSLDGAKRKNLDKLCFYRYLP